MDWNNDGRVDGKDYVHYKSIIDTGSDSSGSNCSNGGNDWLIAILIICLILRLLGCR